MKAYLRGIYSTALTKLLLDAGFEIAYPSRKIRLRLSLQDLKSKPDVVVLGTGDRQGVTVRGPREYVEETVRTIVERLGIAVIRRSVVDVGAVYRGRVVDVSCGDVLVDLGSFKGLLRDSGRFRVDDEVLVQTFKPLWSRSLAFLKSRISIDGFYMSLTLDGVVRFDERLKKTPRFKELLSLSSLLCRGSWGIRWRNIAAKAPIDELIKEFEELKSKAEAVEKNGAPAPCMVLAGEAVYRLEFPCKNLLDDIRASVASTVRGHHIYRTVNGIGAAVDLAEILLSKGADRGLVESSLEELVGVRGMRNGDLVEFEHRKLDGRVIRLTPGVVEDINRGVLTVRRRIHSSGVYDGLSVVKEPGDYVMTRFRPGGWVIENRYFSEDGVFKGVYVNVNTPIEVVDGLVRYLDLGVDVAAKPGEEPQVLDLEELEDAYRTGLVTEALYRRALEALEEAKRLAQEAVKTP